MTDIVQRLRREAESSREEYFDKGTGLNAGVWDNHPDLMNEAADEIERLREERDHFVNVARELTCERDEARKAARFVWQKAKAKFVVTDELKASILPWLEEDDG